MKKNGKKGSKLALRLVCVLMLAALLCGMGLPAAGAEEEPAVTEPVITEPVITEQPAAETPVVTSTSADKPEGEAAIVDENQKSADTYTLSESYLAKMENLAAEAKAIGGVTQDMGQQQAMCLDIYNRMSDLYDEATAAGLAEAELSALDEIAGNIVEYMMEAYSFNPYAAVELRTYTITFQANGGNGRRYTLSTDSAGNFTFPDPATIGITPKSGYTFAGWNTKSAGTGSAYSAGVEINVTENVTYYATWINTSGTGSTKATYYIRLDGIMPYEPSSYNANQYTAGIEIDKALYSAVSISNNLAAVEANLANKPTDAQIKEVYSDFDPATQEVVWYVIKLQDQTTYFAGNWHVDGVIKNKNMYWVTYNPNGGTADVPAGRQYYPNNTIKIEYENNKNVLTSRAGYTFLGWDEDPNATTPTYPYNADPSSFTMPERDVNLYAIWRANDLTPYTVEYYLQQPDGSYLKAEDETTTKYGTTDTIAKVEDSDIKSFTGYEYDPNNANNVLEGTVVPDGSLTLKLYYERTLTSVIVTKKVAGNMGDTAKEFDFTYSCGENSGNFKLAHNGSYTIENLPIGSVLTITEGESEYTVAVTGADQDGRNATVTVAEGVTVTFTNTKEVNIDTGISLDTLPYVLLLGGMAVLGGALLLRRKVTRA